MTHLPPKAPPMAQKWPSFNYQATTTPMSTTQPSSWMDDFVDFSSARRNRRSDEAIQFVETPFTSECRDSNGFERLDDEQLSSMFTDEFTGNAPSLKASSTASDQNSDDDEPKVTKQKLKSEPGEVEDHSGGYEHDSESGNARANFSSDGGTIIDPKRVKRILANRQSAQRSRIRKLHYISELERSVTSLQTEVSTLSPRVAYLDHQRLILNVDNSSLKQRIAALAQDKIFKDAHQEALRKEIERLRRVYQEQNMNNNKKDNNTTAMTSQPPAATVNCTDE